ncbi:hypothetical protein BGX34_003378 [Mortierella sp. NVP85]|nr:hypothetical protein BGX34_003378 [Mortierella sp. NVP85]
MPSGFREYQMAFEGPEYPSLSSTFVWKAMMREVEKPFASLVHNTKDTSREGRSFIPVRHPKRSRDDKEFYIVDSSEKPKKAKRPRKALQLQERLEIIEFCEENQSMSMYDISKRFNVPRPTVYGIIKDKDRLRQLARSRVSKGLTLQRYSTAESRFRILEELLVAWSENVRNQGFPVTDEKITAQAFEIHRMLSSGIVAKPLPPCWQQRFKERRSGSMFANRKASSTSQRTDSWSFQEDDLSRFSRDLDDVFMCGVARRDVHIDKIPQGHSHGKEINAGVKDLTTLELVKWLEDFDKELDRSIILILDLSTWNLLQLNPEVHGEQDPLAASRARLKNIVIVKVPEEHSACHPMATGLAREFKLLYVCFLLNLDVDVDKRTAFRDETTFVDRLRLIRHAWFSVRDSTIGHSFEMIERSLQKWAGQHRLFLKSSTRKKNSKASPLSRGMVIDEDPRRHPLPRDRVNLIDKDLSRELRNAFPDVPDTVIQYYLTQEADVGPSSFLRTKVKEMQRHGDFEGCFGSFSFGQVRRFGAVYLARSIHEKNHRVRPPRIRTPLCRLLPSSPDPKPTEHLNAMNGHSFEFPDDKTQVDADDNPTGLDKDDILPLPTDPYSVLDPPLSDPFDYLRSELDFHEFTPPGRALAASEMAYQNLFDTIMPYLASPTIDGPETPSPPDILQTDSPYLKDFSYNPGSPNHMDFLSKQMNPLLKGLWNDTEWMIPTTLKRNRDEEEPAIAIGDAHEKGRKQSQTAPGPVYHHLACIQEVRAGWRISDREERKNFNVPSTPIHRNMDKDNDKDEDKEKEESDLGAHACPSKREV